MPRSHRSGRSAAVCMVSDMRTIMTVMDFTWEEYAARPAAARLRGEVTLR